MNLEMVGGNAKSAHVCLMPVVNSMDQRMAPKATSPYLALIFIFIQKHEVFIYVYRVREHMFVAVRICGNNA